jgi:hypothetical protein
MIKVYLFSVSLILSGCSNSALLAPTLTPAPQPTLALIPTQAPDRTTGTETWDELFANTIYHRLEVDDTIPEPGQQATIRMIAGQPTALFPDSQGLVLIFEVPAVPSSQEETTRTAVLLIGTAVSVAKDQQISLSGVEVIFYTHLEPFIGFRAMPPWSAQDISVAPLAEELKQKIEEKVSPATPTPRPTVPLSGG